MSEATAEHQCPHCDRAFGKAHGLAVHIARSHKAAPKLPEAVPFACEYCGTEFSTRQARGGHVAHCPKRPKAGDGRGEAVKRAPKKQTKQRRDASATLPDPSRGVTAGMFNLAAQELEELEREQAAAVESIERFFGAVKRLRLGYIKTRARLIELAREVNNDTE